MIARVIVAMAVAGVVSACAAPVTTAGSSVPTATAPAPRSLEPAPLTDPGYSKVSFDTPVHWPSGDIVKAETPQQYYSDGKAYWVVQVFIDPVSPGTMSDFFVEMYGATAMFEPVTLPDISGDPTGPLIPGQIRSERYAFVPTSETALPSSVVLSGTGTQRPYTAFTGQVW